MAGHIDPQNVAERRTVAGLFPDRDRAEQAIDALKAAGFTGDQIGVALRDRTAQGVLLEDTGTQVAEEAATTGALGGGLLGGLAGLLIGIGALVIPGLGPVVAGGVLATAFGVAGGTAVAGAGIGAAAGDSLAPSPASGFPNRRRVTSRPGSGPAGYWSPSRPGHACWRRWRSSTGMARIRDRRRGRGPSGADAWELSGFPAGKIVSAGTVFGVEA